MAFGKGTRRFGERGKGSIKSRIEVRGLKELSTNFTKTGKRFVDYRPLWRKLKPIVEREQDLIMSTQGSHTGKRWSPLTAAYKNRKLNDPKLSRKGGGKLLLATGALRKSIRTFSMTKKSMRHGTKGIPYARAINFTLGLARPFIEVTDKMEETYRREANRFVQEIVTRYFNDPNPLKKPKTVGSK